MDNQFLESSNNALEQWEGGAGLLLEYLRIQDLVRAKEEGAAEDIAETVVDIATTATAVMRRLRNKVLSRGAVLNNRTQMSASLLQVMELDIGSYLYKLLARFYSLGIVGSLMLEDDIMSEAELLQYPVVFDSVKLLTASSASNPTDTDMQC